MTVMQPISRNVVGSHVSTISNALASKKLSKNAPISSLSESALSTYDKNTKKKLLLNPENSGPQENVKLVYNFLRESRSKIAEYRNNYDEEALSKSLAELKMGLDELPKVKNVLEIHTDFYIHLLWLFKDVKHTLTEYKTQLKSNYLNQFKEIANFDLSSIGNFPKHSVVLKQQQEIQKALGIQKAPPSLPDSSKETTETLSQQKEIVVPSKITETPKPIPALDENDEDVARINQILKEHAQKNIQKKTSAENTTTEDVNSSEKPKTESSRTYKPKFSERFKTSTSYVTRLIPFGAMLGAIGAIKVVYDHFRR